MIFETDRWGFFRLVFPVPVAVQNADGRTDGRRAPDDDERLADGQGGGGGGSGGARRNGTQRRQFSHRFPSRGPGVVARTLYARSSPNRINCFFIKTYTPPHTMYPMRADADGMTAAAAIGRD